MQIREAVTIGAPPLSTLSTSTSCQSSLPCHPSAAHPNAPLGAGLCIFNKFRESSKPAISAGGCNEGGFSAASQTVSSRLFMCEAFAILLVSLLLPLHLPSPPPFVPSPCRLCHSFSPDPLSPSLFSARCVLPSAFE